MSEPTVSAKRVSLAYALLGLLAVGALVGMIVYVLTADNRRDQARIASRYYICQEVEKLKRGEREDALRSYRERHRTLRLLKVASTPELQRLFRTNRDRILARYAEDDCVKVARDPLGLDIHVPEEEAP